ncbi:MAG: hypothetical protein DI629_11075 [Mesorhizobium amorphae]|nr:MAG: hypothetical protein DI629_11075 [Mesorhizobium amorphae]
MLNAFRAPLALAALGLAALALAPQGAFAHEYKAGTITIGHPWSRAAPPGAKVAAGYVTLTNTGSEPDRLVEATAELAGRGEIHEMAVDANGVMTMRPLPQGVEVPPGATVALQPGGLHLMFLDLSALPQKDKRFKGTLRFEKGGTVEVEYAVEAMGGSAGHDHGGAAAPAEDHSSH